MTTPIRATVRLELHVCPVCGLVFALPDYYVQERQHDGADYHCPNGCTLAYDADPDDDGPTSGELQAEIARLKGQLVDARHRAEQAEAKASRRQRAKRGGNTDKA